MKLERILVPLDGSELSSRILRPVRALAARAKAEVRAIRVLDGFEADQAMLRGEDPYALAAAQLGRELAPLDEAGIATAFDSYLGDPAGRILDDAATYKASLIAMATHGRSGMERWFRGSVAERVLRRSTVPVFLANPHAIGESLPVRRILVPLDGSALSAEALPLAADFARAFGAELILLHVIEPADDGASPKARAEALELLEQSARRLEGLPVRTHVATGSPALGILEASDAERVDLVAMTTHGRSGISRWAFGSTAEDVVRHARAPLLIVHAQPAAAQGPSTLEQAVAKTI